MSDDQKIGALIDGLGVTSNMRDGDLVAGVIVLLKVVDGDGQVVMRTVWSDGVSWVERRGMVETELDSLRGEPNIAGVGDE